MKQKHAYLKTSVWHRDKIKDPYQAIARAFSFADITYYRKMIKEVLLSSCSKAIYRKKDPGNLIFEFGHLEAIINAAFILTNQKKKSPLSIPGYDLMNKNLYCSQHPNVSEWDYFPRGLSKKEYINPYVAFRRFFQFQCIEDWKKDMEQLLDDALTQSSEDGALNLLPLYVQLISLVEAAHLINVREITHIEGHIKNRF